MFGAGDAAEKRFIREALLALGSDRPGLQDAAGSVRRWDRVLAIATAGSVAESIWSSVCLRGLEGEIPEPIRTAFQDAHASAIARNALLLSEGAEVQAAFTAAGIESVILKGPGLLVAHYPDIGARHVADLDILVRRGEVARAEDVARGIGARDFEHRPVPYGKEDHIQERGLLHAPALYTKRDVVLEIHYRVPGRTGNVTDPEFVFARSRSVVWNGRTLRIPSAADLGSIACLHAFDGHVGESRILLRHLADLAVVIGTGAASWDEVVASTTAGEGAVALAESIRMFDTGSPDRFQVWRHAVALRTVYWMRLFAGAGTSSSAIWRIVLPSRQYMAAAHGLAPESKLLPLFYLWRPIRGLWALTTGRWR